MKSTLKVGIIQQANTSCKEDNQTKLANKIFNLAAEGAELIVLQELHDSLYFCQVESTDNFDLAVEIPAQQPTFIAKLPEKRMSFW